MSAKKALQSQYGQTRATQANVLDFDQRIALRDALRATGKFGDVRIKMDSRRGHLNLFLDGRQNVTESAKVVSLAEAAGFVLALNPVTVGFYDATYRVTTLALKQAAKVATEAAPKAVAKSKPKTLAQAIVAESTPEVKVAVYLNYERLGDVTPAIAKQIRQLVAFNQKPVNADVEVVDLKTSQKVTVTVPYDVAQAVKAQVPSFNQGAWSIKSTHGISILKQNAGDVATEKTWVIA